MDLTIAGSYTQNDFAVENGTVVIACFAEGTRIATPSGETPVEQLRVGTCVLTTAHGALPIVWIGRRRIASAEREDMLPIRIAADAFGPAVPRRDLYLSPDHAVFAGGVLIPVKLLVNGTTITQQDRDEIVYWHFELPRHAVILAEALPTESYLDTGNRAAFTTPMRRAG